MKRNKRFTYPNEIFTIRKTKYISETRCRIQTLQDFGLDSLPCDCRRQEFSEVVVVPAGLDIVVYNQDIGRFLAFNAVLGAESYVMADARAFGGISLISVASIVMWVLAYFW